MVPGDRSQDEHPRAGGRFKGRLGPELANANRATLLFPRCVDGPTRENRADTYVVALSLEPPVSLSRLNPLNGHWFT
jgi:hypothetical protein